MFVLMECTADPLSSARLDRQLDKLDRLADLGLEIVQALAAQAKGTGPQVVEGDVALAYERLARGVRMAVMLQSRLTEDARGARETAADPAAARKDAVARVVKRVAEADGRLDGFQMSWARREARERLEHDDIYGQVMSQPVSDLVAAICRDLGLTPDWARLAAEAWAQDEIDSGEIGGPLQDLLDSPPETESAQAAPLDSIPTIPTYEERLQALAQEAAVVLAARQESG